MTVPNRERGFTLIELLVSLAILTMFATLLVQGVASGRTLARLIEKRTVAGETVQAAQGMIRDRIERAVPLTRLDASSPYVDFSGRDDAIEFFAPPAASARPAGIRRQRLRLTGRGDLVLGVAAANRDGRPGFDDRTLLSNVRGVDIAYFGATGAADGAPRWTAVWDFRPALPRLVRVRVRLAAGDRRAWPDLLIRPGATIDSNCRIDRATGGCRGRS